MRQLRASPFRSLVLVLAAVAGWSGCQCGSTPSITSPLVLGYWSGRARIEGRGFGAPGAGSEVVSAGVVMGSQTAGVTWTDTQIDLELPAEVSTGEITVRTPAGVATAPLEVYRLEEWDLPLSAGTNASPLALARDGSGRLWINEEFHNQLKTFDPGAPSAAPAAINLPHPADPGPFAVFFDELFGVPNVDQRTQTSVLGESILVDPAGYVWFTEGGGLFYEPTQDGKKMHPNHSRVLRYHPPSGAFRVYNVPGDRNEAIGVAWDAARGRLWFAEGGRRGGGAITGFDPERAPWDNAFDFSTSLDQHVNPPNPLDGFRRFPVPDSEEYPAQLVVDAQGGVWFTSFLGNRVSRLDPDTGVFRVVPFQRRLSTAAPAAIFNTGGHWQIAVGPDGAIYLNEGFDMTIARVDAERVRRGDAACEALDAYGRNPCVRELAVDPPAGSDPDVDLLHSIAFDASGRLWYGRHGPNGPSEIDTLGVVPADLSGYSRFPPLRAPGDQRPVGVTGIVTEPDRPVIWFLEFWSKKVGRLTRVDP